MFMKEVEEVKRPRLKKIAASILAAVMMLTSSPAAVFAEDMLDLSDTGIMTEVDSVTDLTEEDVEFLPSGEDDLPEISETPGQDPGCHAGYRRAGNSADHDPLGIYLLPCLPA